MLRAALHQQSMLEVKPDEIGLADNAFERHLPRLIPRLVSVEDFKDFYAEGLGGGSRCPLVLVGMLLLQNRYNVSDRELIARCRRDLGWRYALGLGPGEPPPGQATVQRFRAKLRKLKSAGFLHACSLKLAEGDGLVEDVELQAVDSTNTDCRGAVIDTFNLVAAGVRTVINGVARWKGTAANTLAAQWELSRYMTRSIKGAAGIDWSDEKARNALITEEIQDADRVPGLVEGLGPELPAEVSEALELLALVAHQDVEKLDDATYRVARGTAKGRIISITDPEARHGRKSSAKRIQGFKTHVMGTIRSQLVTSVHITNAGTHDALPTLDLIKQAGAHGLKPQEAVADAAYGTGANLRACEAHGVSILTKQGASSHKDSLPKRAFDINLKDMRVTCPAGETTERYTLVKDGAGSGQRVPKFHFDKETCQECALRATCSSQTRKGRNRVLMLSVYEAELQRTKTFNASPRAGEVLRSRSAIERLISHLVRMGMRRARYFGMHMVQFQAHMVAAAYNVQRYITLMAARPHPAPR